MQNIPVASSKALSITIRLAEPSLFLRGFQGGEEGERSPAMLRGTLVVKLKRATKIRSIGLRFSGKARTIWPEGKCEAAPNLIAVPTSRHRDLLEHYADAKFL